jgi:hypothetical protein
LSDVDPIPLPEIPAGPGVVDQMRTPTGAPPPSQVLTQTQPTKNESPVVDSDADIHGNFTNALNDASINLNQTNARATADKWATYVPGGKMDEIIDNLNRFNYAKNAVVADSLTSLIQGGASPDISKSFGSGWDLSNKATGQDVLNAVIGKPGEDAGSLEKIARGLAGFGWDVFTDPVTYTEFGGLTKAGKLAELVTSASEAAKGIGMAGKATDSVGDFTKLAEGWKAGLDVAGNESKVADIAGNFNKVVADTGKNASTTKLQDIITKLGPEATLGKDAVEQAKLGQRALVSFAGQGIGGKTLNALAYQGIDKAGKALADIPAIDHFLDTVKGIFQTESGNKKADAAMTNYMGSANAFSRTIKQTVGSIQDGLGKMKGIKNVDELVSSYIMHGAEVPDNIKELGERYKQLYSQLADWGEHNEALKNRIADGTYMKTKLTAAGADLAKTFAKASGKSNMEISASLSANLEKVITRNMTPHEANKLVEAVVGSKVPVSQMHDELLKILGVPAASERAAGMLNEKVMQSLGGLQKAAWTKGINTVKGGVFRTDMKGLAADAMKEMEKAISGKQYENTMKNLGMTDEAFNKLNADEVKGLVKIKGNGPLSGLWFHKDVARAVNNLQRFRNEPEVANRLFQGIKDATNLYKRYTTTLFPGYYAKIFGGHMWNGWIANKVEPWEYSKGLFLSRAKNPEKFMQKNHLTGEMMDGKRLLQAAREFNVTASDLMSGDQAATMLGKGGKWNPASPNFAPIKAGQALGQYLSDSMRLTNFIHLKAQGFSDADAALKTKAALFDYGSMTPSERKYASQIFPFYAWSRNNIPLQLKELIHQPGQFAAIGKAKTEVEQSAGTKDVNESFMPEFMRDEFPILYSKLDEPNQYKAMMLGTWLPALEGIDAVTHPVKKIGSSINPFFKEAIQQALNHDFFTGQPITTTDTKNSPEMDSLLGLKAPRAIEHMFRQVRLINALDKFNPWDIFGSEKVHGKNGQPSTPATLSIFGQPRTKSDIPGTDRATGVFTSLNTMPFDAKQAKVYAYDKMLATQKALTSQAKHDIKIGAKSYAKENIAKIKDIAKEFKQEEHHHGH